MGRDESAATSPNPSFLLPRSHSHFGSHPSLIAGKTTPLFSYTCVEPILQPFCFQIHACNGGGCPPSSGSRLPIPYPLSPTCPQQSRGIPFLFTFLRNLLHFFALAQISTLFFSSDSALFAKNHPGWGAICRFCDRWRAASQRAGANLPHSVNRSLKIKRAATRAALLKSRENFCALPRYFFSSAGFSAGGGAAACAGGAGVCVAPDMPSLKLRIPSPNPFMISGMRLPPKKISITARTTSQ